MSEVKIFITQEQGQLILESLAELPFKQVFELIGELNRQARLTFPLDGIQNDVHATGEFFLTAEQMRLILKGLADMPFQRVQRLIKNLHQQLQEAYESDR